MTEQLATTSWQNRQGLENECNLAHYYRLTADNRLLMGRVITLGYGANMNQDRNAVTFARLEKDIVDTFPALRDVAFTHR